ncbi:CHAT domain-containing protein [Leptolyngbya sp. PL-A3]|uniref:CHAT domain-containing protein n=1 Tax=Leptolyngbya sp. PL-A3 TaxID=2933911 RepID=UPI0032972A99
MSSSALKWVRFRLRRAMRSLLYSWLAILTAVLCLTLPGLAQISPTQNLAAQPSDPLTQSRQFYEAGRYAEAAALLEPLSQSSNGLAAAITFSNLSLIYQHLGQWEAAERAIATSLEHLQALPEETAVRAQVLEVQGQLQFHQGQVEAALATWEQAAALYKAEGNGEAALRSQLNQAEAMQAMGMYRRAVAYLTELRQSQVSQPDSPQQMAILRNLGDSLRVAGDLHQAEAVLQESLTMAERLSLTEAIARAHLSLGNAYQSRGDRKTALAHYQQASSTSNLTLRTQAELNQLHVLLDLERWAEAQALIPMLAEQVDQMPTSRAAIDARVSLSHSQLRLPNAQNLEAVARSLATAAQQAENLQDKRAESYALGTLAALYQKTGQLDEAQTLTDRALLLGGQVNAPELRYRWEWQLGQILKQKGDRSGAIAAYTQAIDTLQVVRRDLSAINPEAQFSFRDSVEPIHRELVSLLLAPDATPTQTDLEQARFTIESLQLAELDNFFREACLNARKVQIDAIDSHAAVFYPIILSDRLEIILSLPAQPLRHYSTPISATEVNALITRYVRQLRDPRFSQRTGPDSQQVFDWLIRPALEDLRVNQVQTLVFVSDGLLRSIPMGALLNSDRYLIEDYAVALAPTLQLLEASSLSKEPLTVLMGGLSQSRQGFSPLPGVKDELSQLHAIVPGEVILDEAFTDEELRAAMDAVDFPVVHLATHGEFGSTEEDTFILTWNDRLNINEMNTLLEATDLNHRRPIELLVLSACRTAVGDDRAALGLAGVAVRSGARSTLASLWYVSDEATSRLMVRFYQELSKGGITKAEALRQAQVAMIHDPNLVIFSRPYYWSAFVLVGNWL